jgi:hypothetical protein
MGGVWPRASAVVGDCGSHGPLERGGAGDDRRRFAHHAGDLLRHLSRRAVGALTVWYGPQVATPGDPNSTTFDTGWGVTAAETPLLTDVVQDQDCQAVLNGTANTFGHAIGIQLQYTRIPVAPATPTTGSWWPGAANDGNNSSVAPVEGMRVFFNSTMSAGLSTAGQIMFRTLKKYGAVIDDQTGGGPGIQYNADGSYASGGALMIRSELDPTGTGACSQMGISTSLKGIPWSQISGPILMGSDANPNPTT